MERGIIRIFSGRSLDPIHLRFFAVEGNVEEIPILSQPDDGFIHRKFRTFFEGLHKELLTPFPYGVVQLSVNADLFLRQTGCDIG